MQTCTWPLIVQPEIRIWGLLRENNHNSKCDSTLVLNGKCTPWLWLQLWKSIWKLSGHWLGRAAGETTDTPQKFNTADSWPANTGRKHSNTHSMDASSELPGNSWSSLLYEGLQRQGPRGVLSLGWRPAPTLPASASFPFESLALCPQIKPYKNNRTADFSPQGRLRNSVFWDLEC